MVYSSCSFVAVVSCNVRWSFSICSVDRWMVSRNCCCSSSMLAFLLCSIAKWSWQVRKSEVCLSSWKNRSSVKLDKLNSKWTVWGYRRGDLLLHIRSGRGGCCSKAFRTHSLLVRELATVYALLMTLFKYERKQTANFPLFRREWLLFKDDFIHYGAKPNRGPIVQFPSTRCPHDLITGYYWLHCLKVLIVQNSCSQVSSLMDMEKAASHNWPSQTVL